MERTTASTNCIDLEILNQAIRIVAGAQFCISREEMVLIFDGLTIWQKLSTLTSMKDLPVNSHAEIVKKAQESTTRHSGSTPPHTTTASANCIDFEVLNQAITIIAGAQFCIAREEFVLIFDGLSIWQKLSTLTSMKGLPVKSHVEIVQKAEEKSRDQETLDKFVKNLERGSTFGEVLMIWQNTTFQLMVNFRICYIFLFVIFAFSFPIRLVSETYNNIFRGQVSRVEV